MPPKSYSLFVAIIAGLVLQRGHTFTFLIRYALMVMLFLSLLDCRVSVRMLLQRRLLGIVAMMGGIAIVTASLFRIFNPDLATVALVLGMTPTALAAPVVTQLLAGQVEFVMASVLLTNGLVAFILPVCLPLVSNLSGQTEALSMLRATSTVILVPLLLSQGLQWKAPEITQYLKPLKSLSFYLWLMALYLASAKAGHFIQQETTGLDGIIAIALVALVLCSLNFSVGRWVGRPHLVQETGQSLGQKNTLFSVWICLTFLKPTLALGPMFYILFQNFYNAYLMTRLDEGS